MRHITEHSILCSHNLRRKKELKSLLNVCSLLHCGQNFVLRCQAILFEVGNLVKVLISRKQQTFNVSKFCSQLYLRIIFLWSVSLVSALEVSCCKVHGQP